MNSIKWLIDQLANVKYNPLEKDGYSKAVEKIHEQAKEIHKQEIIDAWEMGRFNIDAVGLGEEYYQETFGSKGISKVEPPQQNEVDYDAYFLENFKNSIKRPKKD